MFTTDYVYDALNRLTNRNYTVAGTTAATPDVIYTYDGAGSNFKGRLRSVSSTSSTTNIASYDALGRVLAGNQVTGGQTYSFSYTYNQAGGLLTETYPSGRIITTGYDTAGRFSSLTGQKSGESDKTYTSSFSYAAHGGAGSLQLGNALWEHANFNSRLQPTQIGLGTSSSDSSKLRLDYGFGSTSNNGNVMSQSIVIGGTTYGQSYTYDALNRLATASEGSNWSQTYGYDQYGNRAVTGAGDYIPAPALTPTSTGAYNPATNQRNSAGYAYDLAGNLTTEASTRTMTYDAENRMVSYNGGSGTVEYSYDGDGRRVQKLEAGVTTVYVYDAQGRLAADYQSDAAPGERVTSYLMADHLGSTRVITDGDANVTTRRDYLPFGEEIASSIGGRSGITGYGTVDNIRQRFTGQYRDTESGLDYFVARYLSGPQGRFQTPEPALRYTSRITNPQRWNNYSYAWNRPLALVDRDGQWPTGYRPVPLGMPFSFNIGPKVHQASIERSLGFLPQSYRQILKRGQEIADSDQSNMGVFKHSQTSPKLDEVTAMHRANDYITTNLTMARELEAGGYHEQALEHVAAAMHVLHDYTSPEHEGFTYWDEEWWNFDVSFWNVILHIHGEWSPNQVQERYLDAATRMIWGLFKSKERLPENYFRQLHLEFEYMERYLRQDPPPKIDRSFY